MRWLRGLLAVLLAAALGCAAQRAQDGGAHAPRAAAKGCANLSVVLDNWSFAIGAQLRSLLLADHASVLPDYGRIGALSAALDGLHREVGGLKQQLGRLAGRFADVEAAAERLSGAQRAPPRRGHHPHRPPPREPDRLLPREPGRALPREPGRLPLRQPDQLLPREPDRPLPREPDRPLPRQPDRALPREPDRLLPREPGRALPRRP